jgi:hypothetical protein
MLPIVRANESPGFSLNHQSPVHKMTEVTVPMRISQPLRSPFHLAELPKRRVSVDRAAAFKPRRLLLSRVEDELNYFSCFFRSSFKPPLVNRSCGRFDEHRIPSHRLDCLNAAIWPNHNFQPDRTTDVHAPCECRISGSNSIDDLSVRRLMFLSRAGHCEQSGTHSQHVDQIANPMHAGPTFFYTLSAGTAEGENIERKRAPI